jgi:hypothetical protein
MRQVTKLLFLGCLLLILGRVVPAAAAPQQQTNLLQNPGFEQPYSAGGVANAWFPWHENVGGNNALCNEPWAGQPLWSQESTSALIHQGSVSQHVGNQYNKWHAGVAQDVTVTPGSTYRFTFWARGRTANEQYPDPSYTNIPLNVQARIDPQGRGLWSAAGIVAGGTGSPHDTWQQFSVEATATGNKITVFVSANLTNSQCTGHMDVWFDDAQLVEVGPPPTNTPPPVPTSPPAPAATNTPVPPTATPTSEVPPTNTPEPTVTPTHTPEPPKGGKVCLNAFADENGNGFHDTTEGYMGRVTLTLAQNNVILGTALSGGTADPVCFEDIPAGEYEVAQIIPAGLETTTAPSTNVTVQEGSTVGVEFGSRIQATVQPPAPATEVAANQPTPDTSTGDTNSSDADDDGPGALAFVGLAVIGLAVVLLGGLIFLVLRQQSR